MTDLPRQFIDASMQHMAPGSSWVPFVGMGALTIFGLILLFKGAKLARLMSALVFAAAGAVGASFIAHGMNFDVRPALLVGSVIGLLLGAGLFRFWLSLLIAAFFVASGLMIYGNQTLAPHILEFDRLRGSEITLRAPGEMPADSPQQLVGGLWAYLAEHVPNFQSSLWSIVGATAVAGLLCGLLLPRMARAFFAATAGVVCLVGGGSALLQALAPETLKQAESFGSWLTAATVILWAISLYWNLRDMAEKKAARQREEERAEAAANPA